jgi:hypothetical protein
MYWYSGLEPKKEVYPWQTEGRSRKARRRIIPPRGEERLF